MPIPNQLLRKIELPVVDVAKSVDTVRLDVVAISDRPSEDEVMIEFAANDVAFVPPLATVSSPEMVERVVVACHVGTPLKSASVNPSVPADVVASLCVPLPMTTVLAWIFPHPVPPTVTASVDDALQTPELMTATPVRADESMPVPPCDAVTMPARFASERHVVPMA